MNRTLKAAEGYMELNMPEEALRELHELGCRQSVRASVMIQRIRALTMMERYRPALALATIGISSYPGRAEFYLVKACAHECAGEMDEAKEVLLHAPQSLLDTDAFQYGLACYEAGMGRMDSARDHLDKAISLNKDIRKVAKEDPRLQALC